MDNIKLSSFENICRACMYTSDLIYIQDNKIIDVLQFLSGYIYSKTDELPQKLCLKCIKAIEEIQTFAVRCKQTHLNLIKTLNYHKSILENQTEESKVEFIEIKPEINDDPINQVSLIDPLEKYEVVEQIVIKNEESSDKTSSDEINNLNCNLLKPYDNDNRFACDICTEKFKYLFRLEEHKKIHKGPYECDLCTKTFANKSYLVKHRATHNRERPFECDICMKCFKQSVHLIEHKRIHSGERPYQCKVCCKAFLHKSSLVKHKLVHSDERRFKCDICLKSFKHSRNLVTHRKLHSDELGSS